MEKANMGAYIINSDFSVQEQEQKLKTWASENDAKIYGFYIDSNEKKSIRLEDRQEFKRLINDVKNHKIDSILTIDYERLTTDKDNLNNTLSNLKSSGVNVYSISDVLRG